MEKVFGRRGAGILLLAFAFALYASYGLQGSLRRDDANCVYAGQRAAAGVPPYVGMFTMAPPVSQLLAAIGVIVANAIGADDLYTTRALYLTIGALAVGAAYCLGLSTFLCRSGGALTALTMLSFACFTSGVVAGPQKKVPMVLFEILSLWWTIERRWLAAGAAGALAAMTWQPMLVLPIVTLIVAAADVRSSRMRSVGSVLLGISGPAVVIVAYFALHGALRPMFDGVVRLPFHYLSRPPVAFRERLLRPLRASFEPDFVGGIPMLVGLAGCFLLFPWRVAARAPVRAVLQDRSAAVLLSLPAPVLWSFIDFQYCPDLYVLYPYAALGFSALVLAGVRWIERRVAEERRHGARVAVLACVAAFTVAIAFAGAIRHRDTGLHAQRTAVLEVERRMGAEAKLVSVGAPEALVLLHRVNPNPYPFIADGIGHYIAANTQGGFDAFIHELATYDPDVIAFGPTGGHPTKLLIDWIIARYQRIHVGPMTFFVRKGNTRLDKPAP